VNRVLVIEDELDIAKLVQLHLQDLPCEVSLAFDGIVGLAEAEAKPYDLVILDIKLPGIDGLEVCRRLRARGRYTPILMLTSKSSELDRVLGLEMGADDYLTKPFSMLELSARVGALTRRTRGIPVDPVAQAGPLSLPGLELEPAKRSLRVRGRDVPVTPHEFRLLYQLASNRGVVFTRERLLAELWHGEVFVTGRSVDTLVKRLRKKIEVDPADPQLIVTVWGDGYKFADV